MFIMFIKDVVIAIYVRYVHGRPWIMNSVFAAINYTFLRLQATSRVPFRRVEVTRGLGADGHEVSDGVLFSKVVDAFQATTSASLLEVTSISRVQNLHFGASIR